MVEKILNWFARKDGFVRVRAEAMAELNDNIAFQKRKCEELDGVVCELMDEIKELRAEIEAFRRPPVYKAAEINSGLFGEIMDEFINGPRVNAEEDD